MAKQFVYISTWKLFSGSTGLGLYTFDDETGALTFEGMQDETLSCGASFIDEKRGLLYINNEVGDLPNSFEQSGGGGLILAFRIDPRTGRLTKFCEHPSYGADPCMLAQDVSGNYLVVANHGSRAVATKIRRNVFGKYEIYTVRDDASLVLFPLEADGQLGDPLDVIVHNNPRPGRPMPHPHTTMMSPSGEFVVVCDNGYDRIYVYRIDKEHGLLSPAAIYEDTLESTPRFCLFHPTLPYFYMNHEYGSLNVTTFRFEEDGHLVKLQDISSMDPGFPKKPRDEGQGFRMHPNGKYLYNAVAGPNEIAVFEINQDTGLLTRIQNQKVEGVHLRSCTISPNGRFMITTCVRSGDIAVFAIGEGGKLTPTGHTANQPGASWSTFCTIQ